MQNAKVNYVQIVTSVTVALKEMDNLGTWKDRNKKTTWTVAILVILVVIFSSSTVFFYLESVDLKAALITLITSFIEKSDCNILKKFQSNNSTMEAFGDLITKTMKEKNCI